MPVSSPCVAGSIVNVDGPYIDPPTVRSESSVRLPAIVPSTSVLINCVAFNPSKVSASTFKASTKGLSTLVSIKLFTLVDV